MYSAEITTTTTTTMVGENKTSGFRTEGSLLFSRASFVRELCFVPLCVQSDWQQCKLSSHQAKETEMIHLVVL
jgi:hypothetical protein